MKNEIKVMVKQRAATKIKKGFPLIESSSLMEVVSQIEEGSILHLVDEKGLFLGKGFYGKQNKGVGWILTRKETEQINKDLFISRFKQAFDKRSSLFSDKTTTAFRVFNGEGDGIGGITIDYYDGYYVVTWYSEGIYSFHKEVFEALHELVSYKGVYEKKRFAKKGQYVEDDDFVMGERGAFPLLVKENGMTFAVYLNDGPMVGVFLDQRDVRRTIRDRYAKGKTVLNTFSYTGAFSIAATLGGAKKTTSVDLANRSLEKTTEQFHVNGLSAEEHEIIVMDVFNYFNYAKKKGRAFDLVVLDPPSFARSKKRTFSAAKDYTGLLEEAIAITNKGGVIIASTNSSAFQMDKFHRFIKEACKKQGKRFEIVEQFSLPSDFRTTKVYPEGNYLKVVFLRLLN